MRLTAPTSMPGPDARGDARPRRGLRLLLPLVACALLAACGGGGGENVERIDLGRPPVVVILLDALHAGHLSHLGYERDTTPNLDALAAAGVSFPAAFAPAPYTLATVPSILTGRLPDAHGLVEKTVRLGAQEVTLAELLQGAGYRTCAAVGNLNGSSAFACDQGFEEFVEVFRAEDGRSVDMTYGEDRYHLARAVDYPPLVERFVAGDDGRPLFLYLHILEPHEPYIPPAEYRDRYLDPAYDGPYAQGDSATLIQGRRGNIPFTAEDREAVRALYDANLAHVDAVVGGIFEQLDEAGILDEALIVVTSDHGEAFWQHGEQGHNTTLYDEMLRVPLIVRFPRGTEVPAGLRPDALVSPMDLLPTLCDWLDLPVPAGDLDGVTLTRAIRGEADGGRALPLRSHHAEPWFALRTLDAKTVLVRGGDGTPVRLEHYRLDADPGETRNVSDAFAERVERDVERLTTVVAESAQGRAERGGELTAAEKALLADLGYVDD